VVERAFHHPELTIGWGRVTVGLTTHTVGGLSENDFIVAARLDRLS
jgi:4a-hydroxytetrahydrobiopterin dehydratase